MEIQTYQKMRDKNWEKPKQEASNIAALPSSTIAKSPPSASSSPAHEFSFTISLHQPPPTSTTQHKASSQPFAALDLSPADEIFFHGHLLPLHLLSHLPVSPRSSTNSLDSFTLPITDLFLNDHQNPNEDTTIIDIVSPLEPPQFGKCHDDDHNNNNNNNNNNNTMNDDDTSTTNDDENYIKSRVKSKSFSLFGLPKWRKGCEIRGLPDRDREKKKQKFDVSDILKRYMKMVRPLLGLKGGGSSRKSQHHHQSYSFSGSLSSRNNEEELMRGRLRAQISAPASMRTSPTNSGLLVATGAMASSTSDSTMEELQAAIQAAITHCKNSIAAEEDKFM